MTLAEEKCERDGEATNPGPRQAIIADFFVTVKGKEARGSRDSRVDWCVRNKKHIQIVPGDGECLYRALGKSVGIGPEECREFLSVCAPDFWERRAYVRDPEQTLQGFITETSEKGIWGGEAQIHLFAMIMGCRVVVHSEGMRELVYGEGEKVVQLLYSSQGPSLNHYDLVWDFGEAGGAARPDLNGCTGPGTSQSHWRTAIADPGMTGSTLVDAQAGKEGDGGHTCEKRRTWVTRRSGEELWVLSVNLSGSRNHLQAAMAMGAHVLIVQEHMKSSDELRSWQAFAAAMGWHGVWGPAARTGTKGRSGGVAVLTWRTRPIFQVGEADDRLVCASIAWSRRDSLRIYGIYGFDSGKANAFQKNAGLHSRISGMIAESGRVPWIIGGDWNQDPSQPRMIGHTKAYVASEGVPTVDTGFSTRFPFGSLEG